MEKEFYDSPEKALGRILEDKARKNGRKPYIYFGDQVISYQEMNERANIIAGGFSDIGVSKGSKVCILLPNCLEYLDIYFGLAKLGGVPVALNTAHKGPVLEYMINHSDAEIIVSDKRFLDNIHSIANSLSNITRLIVYPDNKDITGFGFNTSSYQELLTSHPIAHAADLKYSDPLIMLYTSGTTGLSKAVVSPHNQYIWMAEQWIKRTRFSPSDIVYSWSPLFHIIGFCWPICALLADGAIAIVERFSLRAFWDDIRRYEATICVLLPVALELLYEQPEKEDDADNPLRVIMSGPISKSVHRAFEKRFNVTVIHNYGLTEFDPVCLSGCDDTKLGTPGKGLEDVEIKIFDEDDNELPPNEVGEIVARPLKPYIMMKEYYKDPERTTAAWSNLWFHTSDMAYKDEEGNLFFVDRKADAFKVRGENVSSVEAEGIIKSHSSILECSVVGIPSERGDYDPKAVVQLKEGKTLSPEELLHFCEDNMAYFMVPRYVEFVESFPLTQTGRISKKELKTVTDKTWDRDKAGYKLKRR